MTNPNNDYTAAPSGASSIAASDATPKINNLSSELSSNAETVKASNVTQRKTSFTEQELEDKARREAYNCMGGCRIM